jgi:hypothetical protein
MKIKDVAITHFQTAKDCTDRLNAVKAVMMDVKAHDNPDCQVMIYQACEADHMLVEVWTYPDLAAKTRCMEKWQDTGACPPEHSVMDASVLDLADDIIWHD